MAVIYPSDSRPRGKLGRRQRERPNAEAEKVNHLGKADAFERCESGSDLLLQGRLGGLREG